MWHRVRQAVLFLTALVAAGAGCTTSGQPFTPRTMSAGAATVQPDGDQVPGEWLIKVAPEVTVNQLTALYQSLGLLEVRPVAENLFLLRFAPERLSSEAEIRRVGAPGVIFVQPNFRYRALTPR